MRLGNWLTVEEAFFILLHLTIYGSAAIHRRCRSINGKLKDVSFLGWFAGTRSYRDIADPILEFLLAEHNKFLDKEYKEPIPVIVCSNPGCDKLVMPERIGKRKFCSEDCKAANHKRNIPQKERTDYQWLYRLRKKPVGLIRKALRSEENQERFRSIKAERGYGPASQELIRKLERFT